MTTHINELYEGEDGLSSLSVTTHTNCAVWYSLYSAPI